MAAPMATIANLTITQETGGDRNLITIHGDNLFVIKIVTIRNKIYNIDNEILNGLNGQEITSNVIKIVSDRSTSSFSPHSTTNSNSNSNSNSTIQRQSRGQST